MEHWTSRYIAEQAEQAAVVYRDPRISEYTEADEVRDAVQRRDLDELRESALLREYDGAPEGSAVYLYRRARGRPGGQTLHGVAYVLPLLGCHDLHDMLRRARDVLAELWLQHDAGAVTVAYGTGCELVPTRGALTVWFRDPVEDALVITLLALAVDELHHAACAAPRIPRTFDVARSADPARAIVLRPGATPGSAP